MLFSTYDRYTPDTLLKSFYFIFILVMFFSFCSVITYFLWLNKEAQYTTNHWPLPKPTNWCPNPKRHRHYVCAHVGNRRAASNSQSPCRVIYLNNCYENKISLDNILDCLDLFYWFVPAMPRKLFVSINRMLLML